MEFNIGNIIKLLRKHKKMTQVTLAKDICSVKQLSRIEANKSIPTSLLLKEFSYKLGEDISNYFSYLDQSDPLLCKVRIDELEELLLSSSYKSCFRESSKYIKSSMLKDSFYHRQLSCYNYTSALQIEDISSPSVDDFMALLNVSSDKKSFDRIFESFIKPFDYQVISSVILIYLINEEYEIAKDYLIKIIESFERNYIASNDFSYLKALYNTSRIYYYIDGDCEKSLEYSSKGLDKCISSKSIYYMDDFCLLKGKALYKLGDEEEGKRLIESFISLSRLTDNHKNLEKIIYNLKKFYKI